MRALHRNLDGGGAGSVSAVEGDRVRCAGKAVDGIYA